MIAVTGATGHLGHLVIQSLLTRGTAPQDIAALVRDPAKAQDLSAQGIVVRQADYHRPDELAAALQGVDQLLLISSSDMNDRPGQHRNVVQAAKQAGVRLLAYTSLLKADTSQMSLAADHLATEEAIRASGVPYVFLRNGWYLENYNVPQAVGQGAMAGSAGTGRVNAAARADYAEAAAAVLTTPGQENRVYELAGDTGFTLPELAAEIGAQSGKPVTYHDLPEAAYAEMLRGFGLPAPLAEMLANSDSGLARGELTTDRHDLSELIGHPTTTMPDAVRAALQG